MISTTISSVTYPGNGSGTSWPTGFRIDALSEIVITLTEIATDLETVVSSTQFTATNLGNEAGATITYPLSGPALSRFYTIRIDRILPIKQEYEFNNQGGFFPEIVEDALDRLTMMVQQLNTKVARAEANIASMLTPLEVALQEVPLLGVNAIADSTNRFSVNASGALFDALTAADGGVGDMRIKVNKETETDTASHQYQTALSGRAEVGMIGDDEFRIRTSRDGITFPFVLRAHRKLGGRMTMREARRGSYQEAMAAGGNTVFSQHGVLLVAEGTLGTVTPTTTSFYTELQRAKYTSAAPAGSAAGFRPSGTSLIRGGAAGRGGFYVRLVGGIEVFQASCRMFIGLSTSGAFANADPSTRTSCIGMGFDSGQTTLRLIWNDGSGTASTFDLGSNFPTTAAQEMYEIILACEPNDTYVACRVERLGTSFIAERDLTSDLPSSTTFLGPHMWLNNGTTAAAVEIAVQHYYAQPLASFGSMGVA